MSQVVEMCFYKVLRLFKTVKKSPVAKVSKAPFAKNVPNGSKDQIMHEIFECLEMEEVLLHIWRERSFQFLDAIAPPPVREAPNKLLTRAFGHCP